MEASFLDKKWNAWHHSNRLKFALVVDEANSLRNSVITVLREHGWLVHAVSRAEHAFGLLVHIPYSLIVIESELPGMCAVDFARVLQNSNGWQPIRLVVINNCESANLGSQIKETGAFVARKSRWEDDLNVFLMADERDSRVAANYS